MLANAGLSFDVETSGVDEDEIKRSLQAGRAAPQDIAEKLAELDIPREAYNRDIAQIRRLTPGPLRRLVRRLPGAIDLADDAWHRSGLGPRLRTWITREDSLA